MKIGDAVIYKNQKAEIIGVKWGLYHIKLDDSRKQLWVSCDALEKDLS